MAKIKKFESCVAGFVLALEKDSLYQVFLREYGRNGGLKQQ
jgi:hypothetical protein